MDDHFPNDNVPDDELEINLRPAPEVGRRVLVLAALVEQLTLDDGESPRADDQASATFDLREWLRTEQIWPELTQDEVLLLAGQQSPAGDDAFSLQETIDTLAALAWSLNLSPLAEPGAPAVVDTLIEGLPHPWDSTAAWLRSLALRTLDEIAAQREAAELWTWRILAEDDLRDAFPDEQDEVRAVIREAEREGRAAGILPRGGFRVQGRDPATLNLSERNSLLATMLARLKALNWVCGYGTRWDDVPLDI